MAGFDLFIGIDWSGAQGECHKGIQVAEAETGRACPAIISPPQAKGWSRADVIAHLLTHKAKGRRVLAGIDFAFSHPFADVGGYFPDAGLDLADALALWRQIEDSNKDQPHYYGGGIWGDAVLRHYYNAPKRKDGTGGRGAMFQSRRRVTETCSAIAGRSPSPTFNCVGPAGVGTGSLAGMRMLHALRDHAWIWPLSGGAKPQQAGEMLALVEIFPAFYFAQAGVSDRAKANSPLEALNQGLEFYDADASRGIADHVPDHDDLDAIISAAALRKCHDPDHIFALSEDDALIAQREGWIFGVTSPKTTS